VPTWARIVRKCPRRGFRRCRVAVLGGGVAGAEARERGENCDAEVVAGTVGDDEWLDRAVVAAGVADPDVRVDGAVGGTDVDGSRGHENQDHDSSLGRQGKRTGRVVANPESGCHSTFRVDGGATPRGGPENIKVFTRGLPALAASPQTWASWFWLGSAAIVR
jgi:hypothetical protein